MGTNSLQPEVLDVDADDRSDGEVSVTAERMGRTYEVTFSQHDTDVWVPTHIDQTGADSGLVLDDYNPVLAAAIEAVGDTLGVRISYNEQGWSNYEDGTWA